MHNNKKTDYFYIIPRFSLSVLAAFFWITLIFAFDTPYISVCTVLAAVVHEGGHKLAFLITGASSSLPRARLFGFKIKFKPTRSYWEDIFCAAAGPAANVLMCVCCIPLIILSKEAYSILTTVNLATAFSNLLPIKGYDGYNILNSLALAYSKEGVLINIIEIFSFLSLCLMTFFSLYLILKVGEGYWIFTIFFFSLLFEISKSSVCKKKEIKRDFQSFSKKRRDNHIFKL